MSAHTARSCHGRICDPASVFPGRNFQAVVFLHHWSVAGCGFLVLSGPDWLAVRENLPMPGGPSILQHPHELFWNELPNGAPPGTLSARCCGLNWRNGTGSYWPAYCLRKTTEIPVSCAHERLAFAKVEGGLINRILRKNGWSQPERPKFTSWKSNT